VGRQRWGWAALKEGVVEVTLHLKTESSLARRRKRSVGKGLTQPIYRSS